MIRTHARFRSAPLLLATALALASGGALAQEDISKVNGGVSAEAGQTYRDLSTVNGGIRIGDGARLRNAETVNGGIRGGEGRGIRHGDVLVTENEDLDTGVGLREIDLLRPLGRDAERGDEDVDLR